jgi:hypothetical protein
MPFYTKILGRWVPNQMYNLNEYISLIPCGTDFYETSDSLSNYNAFWFYTRSINLNDHLERMNRWIIFHSFLLSEAFILDYLEKGLFNNHFRIAEGEYPELILGDPALGAVIDYDDIGYGIYFLNRPDEIILYKELFKLYDPSTSEILLNYLFTFSNDSRSVPHLRLDGEVVEQDDPFAFLQPLVDTTYLRIANMITLLEIIIGHPPTCEEKYVCQTCGKSLTHRIGSENAWRRNYLEKIVSDDHVLHAYEIVLKIAFGIRHKTVHDGKLPTANRINSLLHEEQYDLERTIESYKYDSNAQLNLMLMISEITRNLILNKYFNLEHFFAFRKMTSMTMRHSLD